MNRLINSKTVGYIISDYSILARLPIDFTIVIIYVSRIL